MEQLIAVSSEGLQAIDGDDDMLTAMARELVENKGIGESADSVWRALGQLRPVLPVTSHEEPEESPIQHAEFDVPAMLPLAIDLISDTALGEPATLPRTPSRSANSGDQLSLF